MTAFRLLGASFVPSIQSSNLHIMSKASSLHAFSFITADTSQILLSEELQTASQTFEPQVNVPALSAFLVIAIVFGLLQLRINSVRDASERRTEALSTLRQVKSAQLDSTDSNPQISEEEVTKAVEAYKLALEEELTLRTIIPGVRIVAPNDPKREEADIAAAKQFLGIDLNIEEGDIDNNDGNVTDDVNKKSKEELLLQSRRRFDDKNGTEAKKEEEGMSAASRGLLLAVAALQIALLVFLSFDPMTADNVFTNLSDSEPPTNLPSRK